MWVFGVWFGPGPGGWLGCVGVAAEKAFNQMVYASIILAGGGGCSDIIDPVCKQHMERCNRGGVEYVIHPSDRPLFSYLYGYAFDYFVLYVSHTIHV